MSFEFTSRQLSSAACLLTLSALTNVILPPADSAETPGPRPPVADWPCQQVLVPTISVPAVWSGPAIGGINWRNDKSLAELVAMLAARKTSLEDADHAIETFAATAGPDKTSKLTRLFAGVFDTLDAERTQVIDGLIRFGRKLKDLAEKIRSEQASRSTSSTPPPSGTGLPETRPDAASLELDLRIFEERRQALAFVCETPALIEQRLFALARAIERQLE